MIDLTPTSASTDGSRPLVIFGTGSFAQLARAYFEHEGGRKVVAFAVHETHRTVQEFDGLPVLAFEDMASTWSPSEADIYVAVGYRQVNQLRARVCQEAKELGYRLASFVSPRAHVWPGVPIGENCFIFEDNTVQPFAAIGDDVVLWSGNHIGHHSRIGDHCFIASHVVVSGHCDVGPYSFIGVNATLRDGIKIGAGTVIGAGALVMKDTPERAVLIAARTELDARTSDRLRM